MCMGRTHTIAGMIAAGVTTGAAVTTYAPDMAPLVKALVVGVSMCMGGGAGQLCDIDHPHSAIAHALGPVTQIPCHFLTRVLRLKHRKQTHRAVAVFVFAAVAMAIARIRLDLFAPFTAAAVNQWPASSLAVEVHAFVTRYSDWQFGMFLLVGFLTAWGLRMVSPKLDHSFEGFGEVLLGGVIAWLAMAYLPVGPWVFTTVAAGVLSHQLADMTTEEGLNEWTWPVKIRIAGLYKTGSEFERRVVAPVLAVVLMVLVWFMVVAPVAYATRELVAAGR